MTLTMMMMTITVTMAAVISGGSVGVGAVCGSDKAQCADGLKCAFNDKIPDSSGICLQVSAAGGSCGEILGPQYIHVCIEGTRCVKDDNLLMFGGSGLCIKVAQENESCNETTGPANMHVCEQGLECIVPDYPPGYVGGHGSCRKNQSLLHD